VEPSLAFARWSARERRTVMSDPMAPGDQAPEGTPGTGENICPRCNGSGTLEGQPCPVCDGSGTVIEGIGGA
jgi:hypothetical protein